MGIKATRHIVKLNASPSQDSEEDKKNRINEVVGSTIQWLDLFIAQAVSVDAGMAARILSTAKEDLVY